jgi:hypothetical protein
MSDIFISFIHEEEEYAEAVQVFITGILGNEVNPFLSSDKFQVYAGEKWLDRIMSELATAKVVLLMLSRLSVSRPWVNFEAGAAWTRDIITIPVCFGGLEKDELPKPYSSLQAVDLMQWDDHEYLARSVAHHLGLPAPVRAGRFGIISADDEAKQEQEIQEEPYRVLRERLGDIERRTADGGNRKQ